MFSIYFKSCFDDKKSHVYSELWEKIPRRGQTPITQNTTAEVYTGIFFFFIRNRELYVSLKLVKLINIFLVKKAYYSDALIIYYTFIILLMRRTYINESQSMHEEDKHTLRTQKSVILTRNIKYQLGNSALPVFKVDPFNLEAKNIPLVLSFPKN